MAVRENRWLRWTADERETLRELDAHGIRAGDVADALGRTRAAVARMRRRMRSENLTELRCGHCGQVKPVDAFVPSQRLGGGYCDACRIAYRRGTEQSGSLLA